MGPKADDLDRLDIEEESEDTPSVEAARAQIEQTRGEMSGTIDAIKEKVNPQTLAQQAKETVSEVTSDVMQKAKETVHNVVAGAKETVHDVMQEAKQTLPTLGANVAHQAVSGAVSEAKEAVGSAVSTARQTAVDTGSSIMETIRANPIPAALIGIGLGWLWVGSRHPRFQTRRYPMEDYASGYPSYYDEGRWGREPRDSERAAPQTDGLASTGAHVGAAIGEIRNKAGAVAGQVQERVSHAADRVQERAGHMAGRVQESVSDLGSRAGEQARRAAGCFQRTLEENPLALGAMALGLGAAVGMMLPGTYREDRLMGPARDQLVERAQETAEDLAARARMVAEEAMDTASQEARNQGLTTQPAAGEV